MEQVPHDGNLLALQQIGAGVIGVKGDRQGKKVEEGLGGVGMAAIAGIEHPHPTV
jgi:hypothetical protein